MRISVVNTHVPYVAGGAEYLANSLIAALRAYGHDVELIRIPFAWYPLQRLIKSTMAAKNIQIGGGEPDLVIGLKFPSYLAAFENKKIWLLHQHRQVYDLWGTSYQELPDTPIVRRTRNMIIQADNACFRAAKGIYTISNTVAHRLKKFNHIEPDGVLYPPLPTPEIFKTGPPEKYIFYPSRVNALKRQLLAVSAMRYVKSDFKLILAGQESVKKYQVYVDMTISAYGLEDRVKWLGAISEDEKVSLMANATAILYIPYDEDYGYVTLEAMKSSKPVLTCHDSGAVTEFIVDGTNGLIAAPEPQALAEAMERLFADKSKAIEMGHNGRAMLEAKAITWERVITTLLSGT